MRLHKIDQFDNTNIDIFLLFVEVICFNCNLRFAYNIDVMAKLE